MALFFHHIFGKKEAFFECPLNFWIRSYIFDICSNLKYTWSIGKEFPQLLSSKTIQFCLNVAYCKFPTLVDVHTVTRTTTMLHQRSKPLLNKTRCERGTWSLFSPVPWVARGITLPRIGPDKLISDRAIWKLLWSAFRSSRHSFFPSMWWKLWQVNTLRCCDPVIVDWTAWSS